MKNLLFVKIAVLTAALAACVTINVYFPAAAAEKAADRIIGDVIGKSESSDAPKAAPIGRDRSRAGGGTALLAALDRALARIVAPAQAAAPDLDVSSAAIRQITDAMKARHAQLAGFYDSGAIGYTADGLIEVRDANAIALAERNSARNLVGEENKDRLALYAEIARANGHPEWMPQIRATFAKRWIANAKPGWYYNDGNGWTKK
jgi:uncharacterized protein